MTTSVRKAMVKNAAGAALGRTGGLENKKAGGRQAVKKRWLLRNGQRKLD
jgi:hypothetical protein